MQWFLIWAVASSGLPYRSDVESESGRARLVVIRLAWRFSESFCRPVTYRWVAGLFYLSKSQATTPSQAFAVAVRPVARRPARSVDRFPPQGAFQVRLAAVRPCFNYIIPARAKLFDEAKHHRYAQPSHANDGDGILSTARM